MRRIGRREVARCPRVARRRIAVAEDFEFIGEEIDELLAGQL
jgi:hypothetical protein